MPCNSGGGGGAPAQSYLVTKANGQTALVQQIVGQVKADPGSVDNAEIRRMRGDQLTSNLVGEI